MNKFIYFLTRVQKLTQNFVPNFDLVFSRKWQKINKVLLQDASFFVAF